MPSLQGLVAVDFGAADVGTVGVRWPELSWTRCMSSLQGLVAVDLSAADVETLGVRLPELCMFIFGGESLATDIVVRVDLEQLLSQGGKASMASQRAYRELSPIHATGKGPVYLGRDCG